MYVWLFIIGIFLDRLSKIAVMQWMSLNETIVVIPHLLNFHYITNSGAAFSLFAGKLWLLLIVTFVVLVLLWYLWRFSKQEGKLFRIGVVLIASGAVGNLIDRLLYGKVIDFLQFGFWQSFPIFNIADCLIVIAAAMIVINLLFEGDKGEKNGQ